MDSPNVERIEQSTTTNAKAPITHGAPRHSASESHAALAAEIVRLNERLKIARNRLRLVGGYLADLYVLSNFDSEEAGKEMREVSATLAQIED